MIESLRMKINSHSRRYEIATFSLHYYLVDSTIEAHSFTVVRTIVTFSPRTTLKHRHKHWQMRIVSCHERSDFTMCRRSIGTMLQRTILMPLHTVNSMLLMWFVPVPSKYRCILSTKNVYIISYKT